MPFTKGNIGNPLARPKGSLNNTPLYLITTNKLSDVIVCFKDSFKLVRRFFTYIDKIMQHIYSYTIIF